MASGVSGRLSWWQRASAGAVALLAATAIAGDAHALVVIAGDGGTVPFSDRIDNLIRPDVVPDKVTKAIDEIRFVIVDALETRFERWQVSMDVAEKSDFHRVDGQIAILRLTCEKKILTMSLLVEQIQD